MSIYSFQQSQDGRVAGNGPQFSVTHSCSSCNIQRGDKSLMKKKYGKKWKISWARKKNFFPTSKKTESILAGYPFTQIWHWICSFMSPGGIQYSCFWANEGLN